MIVPAYAKELIKIKLKLSHYSHISIFNAAINYLSNTPNKNPFEKMPWIVMFLLKQALVQKDGLATISGKEFLKIANQTYKLGDKLVGHIPHETFMLMLRSMLAQQLWYQIHSTESIKYLLLHRELLNRSHKVNNQLFLAKTGIQLDDYYKISLYLTCIAAREAPNSVIRHSLTSFYSHLSPTIPDNILTLFLNLVALPFRELSKFMKDFEVSDANAAELYQETPFKRKPLIIENDEIIIFNAGICVLGLRGIALEILKSEKKFTHQFGNDMEGYIGERLKMIPAEVYTIPELNNIIPIKSGKIADYVVFHNNQLLIFESKSIIPNTLMKCAFDPDHLSKLLRDNFIKGIEQGQETAYKLMQAGRFSSSAMRIIIVTLDDFYIYGGSYVSEHLDRNLESSLIKKYGELPIPMSRVLYITLRDLNTLTEWLKDKQSSAIFDFLDELDHKQLEVGGARFSVSQHISEHMGPEVFGPVGMNDAVTQSKKEMENLLQKNMLYRRSQHPLDFIVGFTQFQQRLFKAFISEKAPAD